VTDVISEVVLGSCWLA